MNIQGYTNLLRRKKKKLKGSERQKIRLHCCKMKSIFFFFFFLQWLCTICIQEQTSGQNSSSNARNDLWRWVWNSYPQLQCCIVHQWLSAFFNWKFKKQRGWVGILTSSMLTYSKNHKNLGSTLVRWLYFYSPNFPHFIHLHWHLVALPVLAHATFLRKPSPQSHSIIFGWRGENAQLRDACNRIRCPDSCFMILVCMYVKRF